MKAGLLGQQLTLMEELKAATDPAHAQLQTAPFFAALASCQLALESSVRQLRALAIVHCGLETALARARELAEAAGLGRANISAPLQSP